MKNSVSEKTHFPICFHQWAGIHFLSLSYQPLKSQPFAFGMIRLCLILKGNITWRVCVEAFVIELDLIPNGCEYILRVNTKNSFSKLNFSFTFTSNDIDRYVLFYLH